MERPPVLFRGGAVCVAGLLMLVLLLGWGHADRTRRPTARAEPVSPVLGPQLAARAGPRPTAATVPAVPTVASTKYVWPVLAPISSNYGPRWGRFHAGIDLAANQGEPIHAARQGTVVVAGSIEGYGLTVILQHPDGSRTLYGHGSRLVVKTGQRVQQGDLLALVGSTGISTGPHLHFEIIVDGHPKDPLMYLPSTPYVTNQRDALVNH